MTPPIATFVFVLLFLCVTVLGFLAANWRRGDLRLLDEWGLGGRRFGTVVTWFLLGGDLYTAYTFVAVPGAGVRHGRDGLLRAALYDPDLSLRVRRVPEALERREASWAHHRGGLRPCALRQPLARARGRADGHRRDDAVYRAATRGHRGRDRRTRHRSAGLYGRSAADRRVRDPRGLYVYVGPARASDDRGRQGPADLPHDRRGDRRDSRPARRLRRDLRPSAAGHDVARGARRLEPQRLQRLCDARGRLGARLVSLPAFGDGDPEFGLGQHDPPQHGAAARLFAGARPARAARFHGAGLGGQGHARVRTVLQDIWRELRGPRAVPALLPVMVRRCRVRGDRHRRARARGDHVRSRRPISIRAISIASSSTGRSTTTRRRTSRRRCRWS